MYEKGGEASAKSSCQGRAHCHSLLVPDPQLLKEVDGKEGNVEHAGEGVEGAEGKEDEEGLPVLLAEELHHQLCRSSWFGVGGPSQLHQLLLQTRDAKSGRCGRYICAIFFSWC